MVSLLSVVFLNRQAREGRQACIKIAKGFSWRSPWHRPPGQVWCLGGVKNAPALPPTLYRETI